MKKSGAVLFLLLLTALFEPAEVRAAEPLAMELKPEGLYVDNVNVSVLQKMFADYGYKDYIYMPEWKYPPLFLNSLPEYYDLLNIYEVRYATLKQANPSKLRKAVYGVAWRNKTVNFHRLYDLAEDEKSRSLAKKENR